MDQLDLLVRLVLVDQKESREIKDSKDSLVNLVLKG